MRRYRFVPILLVALIAAACSSDSNGSAPTAEVTQPAIAQPTEAASAPPAEIPETPAPEPTEAADLLSAGQRDLADALYSAMLEVSMNHFGFSNDGIRCLADGLAGVFSDDRLVELGMNGASVTEEFEGLGAFGLGDVYEISDDEASEMVDRALGCVDWRVYLTEAVSAEGVPSEQASCIASEISDEGIRATVTDALVARADVDFGISEAMAQEAFQACVDVREMLFQTFVQEGLSEESARCVTDGLSDEIVDMMLGGEEPELEDDEVGEMFGELLALQNRCLTPEEAELMGTSPG